MIEPSPVACTALIMKLLEAFSVTQKLSLASMAHLHHLSTSLSYLLAVHEFEETQKKCHELSAKVSVCSNRCF